MDLNKIFLKINLHSQASSKIVVNNLILVNKINLLLNLNFLNVKKDKKKLKLIFQNKTLKKLEKKKLLVNNHIKIIL